MNTFEKAQEAANFIRNSLGESLPKTAIITGTGLSDISVEMTNSKVLYYKDIPNFPQGTVPSHKNQLIKGTLNEKEVLLLVGRFHYYEGFEMEEVCFSVRVLQQLGVEEIIFTNATGGLNPDFEAGEIIVVKDHIYLMPINPLRGDNDERIGPRFPDMSQVYDQNMRSKMKLSYNDLSINYKEGVYVCWQGPSLETPAEYKYLHTIGADLVGMSTIPEVIAAIHSGIKVMVLSVVTNVCFPPEKIMKTTIEDVINVANNSSPKLIKLIKTFLAKS